MLNCYYDFKVDCKGKWKRNSSPQKLAGLLHSCIQHQAGTVSILIGGEDTMAVVSGGDLYVCVYNPDEKMKDLIDCLSKSEGLFLCDSE